MDILKQTHELQKKYYEIAKKISADQNEQAKIFVSLLDAYNDGKTLTIDLYDGRLQ